MGIERSPLAMNLVEASSQVCVNAIEHLLVLLSFSVALRTDERLDGTSGDRVQGSRLQVFQKSRRADANRTSHRDESLGSSVVGLTPSLKDIFELRNDTADMSHQTSARGSAPRAGQLRNAW